MTSSSASTARVFGLDLLRGCSALAVATYHGLAWFDVANVPVLGTYGVYLFFVLSGATMVVAYQNRLSSAAQIVDYLVLRYIRIAPLYLVALLASTAIAALTSHDRFALLGRAALNALFVFGAGNPGETAVVVGGWSIGIEFVFYFLFPVLLSITTGLRGIAVAAIALVAQWIFVDITLTGKSLETGWTNYTQMLSFIGYFVSGCVIGSFVRVGDRAQRRIWPAVAVGGAVLLVVAGPAEATDGLLGLRGAALSALAVVVVVAASRAAVPVWLRPFAEFLGNCSYSVYLLHPLLFRLFRSQRIHASVSALPAPAVVVGVVALSLVLAHLVYTGFERPVQQRLRALWRRRRDAAAN